MTTSVTDNAGVVPTLDAAALLAAVPMGLSSPRAPTRLRRPPTSFPIYPTPEREVRIGLVTACLGDDGELLSCLHDGFDGVVMAGFGVGHVPAAYVAPLTELASRMPVVLASRTGVGPVLRSTYGFPGKERSAVGHTSHLLSARVQFLVEMLLIEIATPTMLRTPEPALYGVPLLRFG